MSRVCEDVPHCIQCGKDAPANRRGWDALDPAEVAMVCPGCKREAKACG